MKLEASTIHTPGVLSPSRIAIGPALLRLRSDEQLVALFRSGHDEAFQVIYDRYHKRLAGYARQMLPRGQDPEDVLQDVFVRAYRALRHDDRQLTVRPWLFRVAHNCCIDELRRTVPVPTDELSTRPSPMDDPAAQVDARETLRRLIEDIGRLPEQQRSALLLREMSGISYEEVATVLDTTVPAVKSLLVRARTGLVRAGEARDTACSEIREQIALAHDRGARATPTVRRHLRDCPTCRSYRGQMRVVDRRMAALLPAGPLATLARLVGLPGGSATGGTAALGAGGTASGGAALGANHVVALVAAAIASAGGAVGLQHVIASAARSAPAVHRSHQDRGHSGASGFSSAGSAAPGGSYRYQTSTGTDTSSAADQGATSGAGLTTAGGAGSSAGSATGSAGGTQSASSPTPTAPPGWVSTGPPPTARPTSNQTGPTPTAVGGDGSASSPTPTTDGTGSATGTGDTSGATGSTSTGSTSTGSTGTGSTGTTGVGSTTGTGTPSTSDPGATTAAAGAGSTATNQTTSSSSSSSGTSS